MNKLLRIFLVGLLALGGFVFAGTALAGRPDGNASQDDISSSTDQSGGSSSGDAVGGQVVGVVSAGDASVDATNRSEDVDIETGDAGSLNDVDQIVGQTIADSDGDNFSSGEISSDIVQAAEATSGDGVGGSVIGVVTSAGGSADVVAANTSEDVDIETGDAFADNEVLAGIGQGNFGDAPLNVSEDDISAEVGQTATAASGDGVGGQVLGIVSAGDASVDATNESTDVDVETGDAFADNFVEHDVGQEQDTGDIDNFSEGEISSEVTQSASANSGDAVAGQVAGVVTSAGGSADLVLANTSEDVDGETGDSEFFNDTIEFIGQFADN